jgi:hypothetical protein
MAVLLLGVPLGLVGARLLHEEAHQRLIDSAQRIAAAVDDRVERHEPIGIGLARFVPEDRQVLVVDATGHRYTAGADLDGPILQGTAEVTGGGTVTVSASRDPVNDRVLREWIVVCALTAVSAAVAVVLAVVVAVVVVAVVPASGVVVVAVVAVPVPVDVTAVLSPVVSGSVVLPASWQKRVPRVPTGFALMSSWTLLSWTIRPSRSRFSGPRTRFSTSHWPAAGVVVVGVAVVAVTVPVVVWAARCALSGTSTFKTPPRYFFWIALFRWRVAAAVFANVPLWTAPIT